MAPAKSARSDERTTRRKRWRMKDKKKCSLRMNEWTGRYGLTVQHNSLLRRINFKTQLRRRTNTMHGFVDCERWLFSIRPYNCYKDWSCESTHSHIFTFDCNLSLSAQQRRRRLQCTENVKKFMLRTQTLLSSFGIGAQLIITTTTTHTHTHRQTLNRVHATMPTTNAY